jgi:DNA repair protein RadC
LSFLAPDDAAREAARRDLLKIIGENLALAREMVALYSLPHMKDKRRRIKSPADTVEILAPDMSILDQEQLRVVVLNIKKEEVASRWSTKGI